MVRSYIWRHDTDPRALHFPRLRWLAVGRVSLVIASVRFRRRRLFRGKKKRALAPRGVRHGGGIAVRRDLSEYPRLGAGPRMDLHADGTWILHWLYDSCDHTSPALLQARTDKHLQLFGHLDCHDFPFLNHNI